MSESPEEAGPSAFCDEIIGKFLDALRGIDGLGKVADRLDLQLIANNTTKEDALKKALFEEPSA